jgi:hypothetical protein
LPPPLQTNFLCEKDIAEVWELAVVSVINT